MIDEQLKTEARAKLFWGDEPADVIAYLQSMGITAEDAKTAVDAIEYERAANVRAAGRKKIVVGILLTFVPIVAWIFFMLIHIIYLKIMGAALLVGLYGIYKIIFGIVNVCSPRAIRTDLSQDTVT